STLSPMVGATVWMATRVRGMAPAESSSAAARATADARDSAAVARARRLARAIGVPEANVHAQRGGPVAISAGSDTLGSAGGSLGFTGQAIAEGLTRDFYSWKRDEFAVIARASFHATLAGLFANVRENPLQAIPLAALAGLGLLLLPLASTNLRMVRGMGGSITRGIGALREGAEAYGAGTLEHRIPIGGDDDLWDTARQFNRMAEGLERARALEQERSRLENELELARRIQARLLPASPPRVAGLDVAGLSEPAREVGGDYYD